MKNAPLFGSIDQMEDFLKTNIPLGLKLEIVGKKDKYEFIKNVLTLNRYNYLDKGDKMVVLKYLKFFLGYSASHLKRCVKKWKQHKLTLATGIKKHKFFKKFFAADIALLIDTDLAHDVLSGEATKRIFEREYTVYNKFAYGNIKTISPSHIYNIRRGNRQYCSSEAKNITRTKAANVNIGIRRKPQPDGKPGYVRIDTVHQGDLLGIKGVYHINIVDEITQFEMIATVEGISHFFLRPVIEILLKLFPFHIFEFHSDNGSEYINKLVAKLLTELYIELSKSRSRHSNDNALVESKNGSIIRKFYGHLHIPKKWAKEINSFNEKYFNIYLNYHRPCGFAESKIDKKGKLKKVYNSWLTPYEKLRSLPNAEQYLKPEFTFEKLDKIALEKSDNDFAKEMRKEKQKMFKHIFNRNQKADSLENN